MVKLVGYATVKLQRADVILIKKFEEAGNMAGKRMAEEAIQEAYIDAASSDRIQRTREITKMIKADGLLDAKDGVLCGVSSPYRKQKKQQEKEAGDDTTDSTTGLNKFMAQQVEKEARSEMENGKTLVAKMIRFWSQR